jgi:Na+-transporting NADH:ubiquinone oxidoreductase subunit NqrB
MPLAGKDPRYFQISFQLLLLLYGNFWLDWTHAPRYYLIYVAASVFFFLMAELAWGVFKKQIPPLLQRLHAGWPSVVISSLGLCLLLRTHRWEIAVLASGITVWSKYLIRFDGRHVFNPSAIGIAATIILTGQAWFSPGQWGSGAMIFFLVVLTGLTLVSRVHRAGIGLVFLGTFLSLLFARQRLYLHWPLDFFLHSVSTGSLLVFSFFMITDPKTIPDCSLPRIIWAIVVAALAFYLATFRFVQGAPLWALVLLQPLVPLLNRIFQGMAFRWKPEVAQTNAHSFLINKTELS